MASKKVANPSNVREWAKEALSKGQTIDGLPEGYTVGDRGRLHPAIREAFNKSHKSVKYTENVHAPKTVTVKTFRESTNGRKTPLVKQVVVSEARAAALAAGVALGKRGRVSADVLASYARGEYAPKAPEAPAESE